MEPTYRQLNAADRVTIESMLGQASTGKRIAEVLGVSAATISRELSRNFFGAMGYQARTAQARAEACRSSACLARRKLGTDVTTPRWRWVLQGMRMRWSPEQIAGRLAGMNPFVGALDSRELLVSHETIYCAIYAMPRGTLRTELVGLLRKNHKTRMPRARGEPRFTGLRNMTPIALRPPEVAARIVPGHWEGDLIKGAGNRSSVGTIVERTSRYLMLVKLDDGSASSILDGFTRRLKTIPPSLRKTMTYDQGSEMASHALLAKQLHIDIFFCDPHSPWQRGSNENANGLVREYLPKGEDLSQYSYQQLLAIEQSLNNRPRKILGFQTPAEVFFNLQFNDIAGVALQA